MIGTSILTWRSNRPLVFFIRHSQIVVSYSSATIGVPDWSVPAQRNLASIHFYVVIPFHSKLQQHAESKAMSLCKLTQWIYPLPQLGDYHLSILILWLCWPSSFCGGMITEDISLCSEAGNHMIARLTLLLFFSLICCCIWKPSPSSRVWSSFRIRPLAGRWLSQVDLVKFCILIKKNIKHYCWITHYDQRNGK